MRENKRQRPGGSIERMNLDKIGASLEEVGSREQEHFLISRDLGVSAVSNSILGDLLRNNQGSPFLIEDYRFGLITGGCFDVTMNLQRLRIQKGDMIILKKGTIVELHDIPKDMTGIGMVISEEMMMRLYKDERPEILKAGATSHILRAEDEHQDYLSHLMPLILQSLRKEHKTVGRHLIRAFISYYNDRFLEMQHQLVSGYSRNGRSHQRILQEFLSLVNLNITKHRNLDFYAMSLCLSARHLGWIIKDISGQTAKEWIDEAIMTRARMLLSTTNMSIQEITDDLGLGSDSFFCRFFKLHQGSTPSAYRKSIQGT